MFDLTGKVALVTGGSMGLGLTCSDTLAAAGAEHSDHETFRRVVEVDLLIPGPPMAASTPAAGRGRSRRRTSSGARRRRGWGATYPGRVPNDFEQWKHGIPGLHCRRPMRRARAEGTVVTWRA